MYKDSCFHKTGFKDKGNNWKSLWKPPYEPSKLVHAHAIDFYRIWKEFGLIPTITSQNETHPSKFEGIYSTFPRILNQEYEYKIQKEKSNDPLIQIVLAQCKFTNFKYIIKRRVSQSTKYKVGIEKENLNNNFK